MADRIQYRRDTAARWAEFNPVLLEGEVGYVTDSPNQYKIGDGVNAWNDLPLRGYTGTIAQGIGNDENAVMSQKTVSDLTGLSEYPSFSESEDYVAGSVINKDGKLYEFTADHAAGAWIGTDAEETSVKKELEKKDTELEIKSGKYYISYEKSEGWNKYENAIFLDIEPNNVYNIVLETEQKFTNIGIYTRNDADTVDNLGIFEKEQYINKEFTASAIANKLVIYLSEEPTSEVYVCVKEVISKKIKNIEDKEEDNSVNITNNSTKIDLLYNELRYKSNFLWASKEDNWVVRANAIFVNFNIGKYSVEIKSDYTINTLRIFTRNNTETSENFGTYNNVTNETIEIDITKPCDNIIIYLNNYSDGGKVTVNIYKETFERINSIESEIESIKKVIITNSNSVDDIFTVKVNGEKQNREIDFNFVNENFVSSNTLYDDRCHITIPSNNGKPVKLIIMPHGAGGTISDGGYDTWYYHAMRGLYFNSLGYAVLTFNGMPDLWAEENSISNERQCGNWMANEACERAYEYVINNYNIDKNGCYIFGTSQGGMVAENIIEMTTIPIIAAVLEVPAISMKYAQLYLSSAKDTLMALYGFNSLENYDPLKCIGLDPFIRGVDEEIVLTGNSVLSLDIEIESMTNKKYRKNVPTLFITSKADDTVSYKVVQSYVKAIRNAGGNCKLITYENAAHDIMGSTKVIGKTKYYDLRYQQEREINITSGLLDVSTFFERHSGMFVE